jgi:hypothetical protein
MVLTFADLLMIGGGQDELALSPPEMNYSVASVSALSTSSGAESTLSDAQTVAFSDTMSPADWSAFFTFSCIALSEAQP